MMNNFVLKPWLTLIFDLLTNTTFANPLGDVFAHPNPRMAFNVRSTPRCPTIELWYLENTSCISMILYSSKSSFSPGSPLLRPLLDIQFPPTLPLLIGRYAGSSHQKIDDASALASPLELFLTLLLDHQQRHDLQGYVAPKTGTPIGGPSNANFGTDELDRYNRLRWSVRTVNCFPRR